MNKPYKPFLYSSKFPHFFNHANRSSCIYFPTVSSIVDHAFIIHCTFFQFRKLWTASIFGIVSSKSLLMHVQLIVQAFSIVNHAFTIHCTFSFQIRAMNCIYFFPRSCIHNPLYFSKPEATTLHFPDTISTIVPKFLIHTADAHRALS